MSKLNFSVFPIYPAAWLRDKRRDVRKMGGQISGDSGPGEGHGEVSSPVNLPIHLSDHPTSKSKYFLYSWNGKLQEDRT